MTRGLGTPVSSRSVSPNRKDRVHHSRHADEKKSEVIDMSRSSQDILDHADDLARRFEGYERMRRMKYEEYSLRRAVLNQARGDRQVVEAVVAAQSAGISWSKIGEILGTFAQAAQQRYGPVVEQV
jgi:hypothetical protein